MSCRWTSPDSTSSAESFVVSRDVAGLDVIGRIFLRVDGRCRALPHWRRVLSCHWTSSDATSSAESFVVSWDVARRDVIGGIFQRIVGRRRTCPHRRNRSSCCGTSPGSTTSAESFVVSRNFAGRDAVSGDVAGLDVIGGNFRRLGVVDGCDVIGRIFCRVVGRRRPMQRPFPSPTVERPRQARDGDC